MPSSKAAGKAVEGAQRDFARRVQHTAHTAQLTYQGKRIRIDGGVANTFDFMAYTSALDDALQATLTDPAKFDRLADRVTNDPTGDKVMIRINQSWRTTWR